MTDALITELAQIGRLRVISRTSMMRYRATRKPLPEIARELNVEAVVEGTVVRVGPRVRVTAQLIHAPTDRHLWARSYDRELRDVLALQEEVARAIAQAVQVEVRPGWPGAPRLHAQGGGGRPESPGPGRHPGRSACLAGGRAVPLPLGLGRRETGVPTVPGPGSQLRGRPPRVCHLSPDDAARRGSPSPASARPGAEPAVSDHQHRGGGRADAGGTLRRGH